MFSVKTKKSKIIAGTILVLFLAVGFGAYSVHNNEQPTPAQQEGSAKPSINYDPPTEEEKKQTDDHKTELGEKTQPRPSANNQISVAPEITVAEVSGDFVELGSYIPGMFENNGNCVVTFTRNDHVVTRQVQSVAEGRATYCPLVKVPLSEFPNKGTWQVKVTYNSAVYTGASAERNIEIK